MWSRVCRSCTLPGALRTRTRSSPWAVLEPQQRAFNGVVADGRAHDREPEDADGEWDEGVALVPVQIGEHVAGAGVPQEDPVGDQSQPAHEAQAQDPPGESVPGV